MKVFISRSSLIRGIVQESYETASSLSFARKFVGKNARKNAKANAKEH